MVRAVNDLGLVEAVDSLGQGVVIAVADATDRGRSLPGPLACIAGQGGRRRVDAGLG